MRRWRPRVRIPSAAVDLTYALPQHAWEFGDEIHGGAIVGPHVSESFVQRTDPLIFAIFRVFEDEMSVTLAWVEAYWQGATDLEVTFDVGFASTAFDCVLEEPSATAEAAEYQRSADYARAFDVPFVFRVLGDVSPELLLQMFEPPVGS